VHFERRRALGDLSDPGGRRQRDRIRLIAGILDDDVDGIIATARGRFADRGRF
jgi:hypothetical protein